MKNKSLISNRPWRVQEILGPESKNCRTRFLQQAESRVGPLNQPAVIQFYLLCRRRTDMSGMTAIDKRLCSGLNCQNLATRDLKIKFTHRTGFFCERHANEFLLEGILEDMKTTANNTLDCKETT